MRKPLRQVTIFLSVLLGGWGECRHNDVAALAVAGYTMLSPPSNLFAPGAVVLLWEDDQGRAQAKLVCGPRANLGAMWSPRVSETMSSTYKLSRTQKIALEADAVDKFKARTTVEDVQSVTVSFTNPRLLEISEAEVYENIDERSSACSQAIDNRFEGGFRPTFVTSAYAADVEYTVSFKRDAELSKSVKEKRMGTIAAKLGGGHTEITEHSLKAVNLIFAIRADEYLLRIRPNGVVSSPPSDPRPTATPTVTDVCPGSDAPIVPPQEAGRRPSGALASERLELHHAEHVQHVQER